MQVKDFNRCINKLASIHFTPSGHSCEHSQPPKVTMSLLTRKLDENIYTEQQKPITFGKKKPKKLPKALHRAFIFVLIIIYTFSRFLGIEMAPGT